MQLPSLQRREIIENLLDLEIFSSMNTILKEKMSSNKETLIEVETQKRLVEQNINASKDFIKNVKNKLENDETKYKNILKDLDEHVESLKQKLQNTTAQIQIMSESVTNENVVYDKKSELQKLRNKIKSNIEVIEEEIEFFQKNDNCPTCKQKIDDMFKSSSVDEKTNKLSELKDGLSKLDVSYDKVNKKLETIKNIKNDLNYNRIEEGKLTTEIKSLIDKKESMLRDIQNKDDSLITKELEKINQYQEALDKIEIEYKNYLKQKELLNITSVLLKDSGIKSKIIKKYIPIINNTINKFLTDLNFFVMFQLDEEFNEKIKSRYRDEFSYTSFSEGERMKINLAILFTWRTIAKLRNSINTNLLIMDEVFDSSLDSNATEDFLKLLNMFDNKSNVFIISHKTDQLNDKFEKTLKFKKVKNFSRMI
jgi:DNA repair exonuclease SbcCD ATPase subunit